MAPLISGKVSSPLEQAEKNNCGDEIDKLLSQPFLYYIKLNIYIYIFILNLFFKNCKTYLRHNVKFL